MVLLAAKVERANRDSQCHQPTSTPTTADGKHINQEKLKQCEGEPIATLQRPQLMEELWRRCQQQQKDERRHDLYHELMTDICQKWSLSNRFEQPSADKEETGQSEQEKRGIEPQKRVAQAEMADMRIDHEDHRESTHRINVFYPLPSHILCKSTKKA